MSATFSERIGSPATPKLLYSALLILLMAVQVFAITQIISQIYTDVKIYTDTSSKKVIFQSNVEVKNVVNESPSFGLDVKNAPDFREFIFSNNTFDNSNTIGSNSFISNSYILSNMYTFLLLLLLFLYLTAKYTYINMFNLEAYSGLGIPWQERLTFWRDVLPNVSKKAKKKIYWRDKESGYESDMTDAESIQYLIAVGFLNPDKTVAESFREPDDSSKSETPQK